MRWDELFDDLAGQFDAEYEEHQRREAIEDERLRIARLTLRDRLTALEAALMPEERVTLLLDTGERLEVIPTEFGADWIAATLASQVLAGSATRYGSCLIPLAGISSLLLNRSQLDRSLTPQPSRPGGVASRLGFTIPLRDLARRRVHCEFSTVMGQLYGTIDRVGRDHFDLAVHDSDSPRRRGQVRAYRVVPFDQVRLVRIGSDCS